MTNLFSVLNSGATGMRSAQFGISVRSTNATNAATEGYSRRLAHADDLGPYAEGSRAAGFRRVVDPFIEQRLLGARSLQGEASARSEALAALDSVLAEEPGSIGDTLNKFHSALADFANSPDSMASRGILLEQAELVATSFRDAGERINYSIAEANSRIETSVEKLNAKLHSIADLNKQISRVENTPEVEASDLRDRRDKLIREVADIVPVKVMEEGDGRVSVMLSGSRTLVASSGEVTELVTTRGNDGEVRIQRTTAGAKEDVTGLMTSGSIGGLISARNGGFQTAKTAIDQLAYDVANAYNVVHSNGVGLDGGTGRLLFGAPTSVDGAAAAMRVSSDVAGAPERLAGALDTLSLPGDNRVASQLVALRDAPVASGGTAKIIDAFSTIVASVGSDIRSANLQTEHASSVVDQVGALRDSVSGVSTDEEMVAIMQYQRAYEASLQVIRTADAMLEELVNMRR